MRPPLHHAHDDRGRIWVNSTTDALAVERLRAEMLRAGVELLDLPRRVRAGALDGERQEGTLLARERRGEAGWHGLVCLEREYLPGWAHLVVAWLPAARIEVVDAPVADYVRDWLRRAVRRRWGHRVVAALDES